MSQAGRLDHLPIWLIGLTIAIGLCAAREVGYRLGRRLSARDSGGHGRSDLASSALALLSLLMAFTFGEAQDRFTQRQLIVVAEANALDTTYLRIQTLQQPWRGVLSQQMLRYAQLRGQFFTASDNTVRLAANTAQTLALQDEMWATVTSVVRVNAVPTLNGPLLQSVNDMFNLAASRRGSQEARVPASILRMLILYGLVTAAITGFAQGRGRRYAVVSTAVLLLQTLAFCLILDLDTSTAATVQVDQSAMIRTVASIREREARRVAVGEISAAPPGIRMPSR